MFLNSVSIVFAGDTDLFWGMTIAWTTQIENNHIILSIPKSSEATSKIVEKDRFTVSVLSEKQHDIARQYGGNQQTTSVKKDESLLDFEKWSVPVVKNAPEHLLCSLISTQEIENQLLIVGKVLDYTRIRNLPLLVYEKSDYFG